MCASGRYGLVCAACDAGKLPGENGTCKECDGANVLPFAMACVVIMIGLCGLYWVADNTNLANRDKTLVILSSQFNIFVIFVQTLGVMAKMALSLSDPLKKIMSWAALLNFDIQILELECIFLEMSALSSYIMKAALIAVLLLSIGFLHAVWIVVRYRGQFAQHWHTLACVMGTLLLIFLTSMTNTAIAPLECQAHPNGKMTVRRYPSVICGEGSEHDSMIVFAFLYLCIPVSFVTLSVHSVSKFPKEMARGNTKFLKLWAFLYQRFKPALYWYVPCFVVHNRAA